jgi:hypothetical protein
MSSNKLTVSGGGRIPQKGDEVFVWWNTGRKEAWNDAWYVATVYKVTHRKDDPFVVLALTPSVSSLSRRPMEMSHFLDSNDPTFWVDSHPANPDRDKPIDSLTDVG